MQMEVRGMGRKGLGLRSRAEVAILLGSAGTTRSTSYRPNTRTPPRPSQSSGFVAGKPRKQHRLTRQTVSEVRGYSELRARPKTSSWRHQSVASVRVSVAIAAVSIHKFTTLQFQQAPQLAGMAIAPRHRHTWTRPTTIRIANLKHHPRRQLKGRRAKTQAHLIRATRGFLRKATAMG